MISSQIAGIAVLAAIFIYPALQAIASLFDRRRERRLLQRMKERRYY